MLRQKDSNQLEIFEFEHPFEGELDANNRWVKLAKMLPWEEMIKIYGKSLSKDKGRYGIDGRLAVGCLIIKHRLNISDREVIQSLQENIYLQYFVGFQKFKKEPAFDASLFVHLRKRMGIEAFDAMSQEIIKISEGIKQQKKSRKKGGKGETEGKPKNKGKLKIDATVAEQMIEYPTDHTLLNKAREESEKLIDTLYSKTELEKKPRTYRRKAREDYLSFSKKKKKSTKAIRKAVGKQLRYIKRNLGHIHRMLDLFEGKEFPLNFKEQKKLWIIEEVYRQQTEMYKEKKHSVAGRIVNISQPYVRPIPRGKAKSNTEFGAKIGVSLVEGYSRIDRLSWDAYSESKDLKEQVETYRQRYGYYPEVLLADNAYLSRENRRWLKEREIRVGGRALGRPSTKETYYERSKKKKENRERNHIEGKFGQGKNAYGLNKIRARRQDTSESWIAAIFFVMNLITYQKLGAIFSFYFFTIVKKAKNVILDMISLLSYKKIAIPIAGLC
jgi:IS5 family transposase